MKNTIHILSLMVLVTVGSVGFAQAAKKPKGQDVYKEYCKSCHEADSEHGEYTPMSLIQDQWQRFFDKKIIPSHEGVLDPSHENLPILDVISPEQLELIREFAIEHAADSEHPMTCG